MKELITDQVIKMWRKDGKTWISAIAIAALFMAMAFVPGVSAKENLETSVVTVERAADADFTMLAKMFARASYILDNVASLPDMAYDFIEAMFAVTLSEDAITALFTTPIAFAVFWIIETIIVIIVGIILAIPLIISTMLLGIPILGWAVSFVIWVVTIIVMAFVTMGALIIAEMLDGAVNISGIVGGLLADIYFLLSPLWKILYKIIGPIIGLLRKINPIINKGIDAGLGLLGEPIADFGDRFLKEVY